MPYVLCFLFLLLVACSGDIDSSPTPTMTPAPTHMLTPTAIITPGATPTSTPDPTPTATPASTLTPELGDLDGDGWPLLGDAEHYPDCADDDPGIHPGAVEVCINGLDDDCSGTSTEGSPADLDRDGYLSCAWEQEGRTDCNDASALAYPSSTNPFPVEIDGDCDGLYF